MEHQSTPDPGAQPLTAEAAAGRRAELMADPQWRAEAATGRGTAWIELQRLDRAIAPPDPEDETLHPAEEGLAPQVEADREHHYRPPAGPGEYRLPTADARALGLEVDHEVEGDLRRGLHEAGVDSGLAETIYFAAMHAAVQPRSSERDAAEHASTTAALRAKWGAAFDANLKAANDEARAIFVFLPHSVTGGRTFTEYVQGLGLGNSRVVIEQLYGRAKGRGG